MRAVQLYSAVRSCRSWTPGGRPRPHCCGRKRWSADKGEYIASLAISLSITQVHWQFHYQQLFRITQCLDTPLHKAAGWGTPAVVALLLETPGVDPEVKNAVSRSVLEKRKSCNRHDSECTWVRVSRGWGCLFAGGPGPLDSESFKLCHCGDSSFRCSEVIQPKLLLLDFIWLRTWRCFKATDRLGVDCHRTLAGRRERCVSINKARETWYKFTV